MCLIALLMLSATPHRLLAASDNTPIIVIREDDIRATWRNPYVALGDKTPLEYGKIKHIPVTWAVITNAANVGWGLTWAQLIDYAQTAGGELASHSISHAAMGSDAAYIQELVDSKNIINAKLAQYWPGHYCTTFLQPGSWVNDAYLDRFAELDNPIGQAIQATYSQSQGYLGGGWHVGNTFYKYGMCPDFSLDYNPSRSIEAVLATLEIAANTPGAVTVFTCHGVQEAGGTLTYHIPADLFKAFIDRLAELRDAGKIRLMSMQDAYSATFSPGLNLAADPGFEQCDPGPNNPYGPVRLSTGCSIIANGGVGNSKYVNITSGMWAQNECRLDPGRYRLSWWQKTATSSGGSLTVRLTTYRPDWSASNAMSSTSYSNSNPNAWEKKSALALVIYGYPMAFFTFTSYGASSFGIDNISIVREDLDPASSPMNSAITIVPNGCTIYWDTPNDANVTSIRVCWNASSHPVTPSDGTILAEIPAVPGATQQANVQPMNWQSLNYAYFSVFALRGGPTNYSPPDLVAIQVDRAGPETPHVNASYKGEQTVSTSWSSSDPQSGVFQYEYAVGRNPGTDNIVHWTQTQDTATTITNLPQETFYVSVRAENSFGFLSQIGSTIVDVPGFTINQALASRDGASAILSGVISAVFDDCYYIVSVENFRGIKIIGHTNHLEGDSVSSLSGIMTTISGERALIPN